MSSGAKQRVERYGFDVQFERTLAVALCYLPALFGVIGREIAIEKLADPVATLLVRAVQSVAEDLKRGPSDAVVVMQRLRRWSADGRVTIEEIDAALDLINDITGGIEIENIAEEVLSEVVPVLQRHMRGDAVRIALDEYGKRGDFAPVVELVERAKTLGTVDRTAGSKLSLAALDGFARLRNAHRLSTGVPDLDMHLNGGTMRGTASLIVGGAKAGKSMTLTNVAATAMEAGLFVAEATLELSEADQQARLLANLTGIPIDAIMEGTADERLRTELAVLLPKLGAYRVKFFAATVTRMSDIQSWVAEIEREEGRKIDLLVIDYIDKLGSSNPRHTTGYDIQGAAAEAFRLYCHSRNIWGWTASQPKRREKKDRTKRIELDDIADSMNKARVLDLIVTVHAPTDNEIEFYVAGNRHGRGNFGTSPLPHDFACARPIPK
jgi:hypothetical protein